MAAFTWFSRQRVVICLYGGMAFAGLTWIGSYIIWLKQGCMPFLPFVSDFGGGGSDVLFPIGMVLTAVLLVPSWIDYYKALREAEVGEDCIQKSVWLIPMLGVWCSVCIIGVAVNPWDIRLGFHLISAFGVFGGGLAFSFTATALGARRGLSWKRSALVVAIAAVSFILMIVLGIWGHHERAKHGAQQKDAMELMRADYYAYCTGNKGSIHANWQTNVEALMEWILLGSSTVLVFWRLHWDLQGWPASNDALLLDLPRHGAQARELA